MMRAETGMVTEGDHAGAAGRTIVRVPTRTPAVRPNAGEFDPDARSSTERRGVRPGRPRFDRMPGSSDPDARGPDADARTLDAAGRGSPPPTPPAPGKKMRRHLTRCIVY